MLKYDCNRAILLKAFKEPFCIKNVIGKRVQVGRVLQGEGLGLLDVCVVELVDSPGPESLQETGRHHDCTGKLGHLR